MNLNDPTPPSEVKRRQGPGGRMLDYIDARFVMDRLDAAVGQENWQDKFEDLPNGSVRCGIGIRQADGWVWKWDVGDVSDIEPVKGAHSDAFKRAAVKWGIGRDLYGDHPAPRPAQAPKTAPAPARVGLTADDPPWPVEVLPDPALEAAQAMFADMLVDESHCPDHDKAWRQNSKGYYCSTKVGDGWCKRQPSKAWQAAQELIPA
jgi:hypothetical protein